MCILRSFALTLWLQHLAISLMNTFTVTFNWIATQHLKLFNILPNIDQFKCNNFSYAHLYSYEVLVLTDTLHDLCLLSYTKRGFNFAPDYYQYLLLFNAL